MKIKTICEHCGKKQITEEKNFCLNNLPCKFCKKEDTLKELKTA